ncbi:sulfonate ABC transporter ATP-binding protein, partial [Streptomyces sp. SID8455]|nr:sulfonate ABC transporter ATP-binding protein [Streptomyces sp. SID8455]
RVLVMRDGGIAYDTAVGLDRPRGVGAPGFAELRSRLLTELGVEDGGSDGGAGRRQEVAVAAQPDA